MSDYNDYIEKQNFASKNFIDTVKSNMEKFREFLKYELGIKNFTISINLLFAHIPDDNREEYIFKFSYLDPGRIPYITRAFYREFSVPLCIKRNRKYATVSQMHSSERNNIEDIITFTCLY